MIITDIRKHIEDKAKWEQDQNSNEYRTVLMAAVHSEVEALQKSIDALTEKRATAKANRAKRTLMTFFALLEQVPWAGLEAAAQGKTIEARAKDTLLAEGKKDKALRIVDPMEVD